MVYQKTVRELILEREEDELSVQFIGIDSMSRLNFHRHCEEMHSFITSKLGGIELLGFHKVADNTLVNLTPMLTGQFLEDLPWTNPNVPFDNYTFVWKNFSANGYVTMKAEDESNMMMFNYAASGFSNPPFTYYLRPFMLAAENTVNGFASSMCIGNTSKTGIVLDWTMDFLRMHRDDKYFGLSFVSGATHDYINGINQVRNQYLKFLKDVHKENLLQNTVLIFFGDHGIRTGAIRQTFVGEYEERLPIMYIVMPTWFKCKYKKHWKNLKINQNRLTTFFDVYESLKDILKLDEQVVER